MALEQTMGLLAEDGVFVPLPKGQQMTEDTLLLLERQIARSASRHEAEADMSVVYARNSMPCMGGPTLALRPGEQKDED